MRNTYRYRITAHFMLLASIALGPAYAGGAAIKDDFDSLDGWKSVLFPKIKAHTKYSIVSENGLSVLRADADSSASALVFKKSFSIFLYPNASWRWKIANIYSKADPRKKAGDDYPIRVYFIFKYDPAKASLGEKIKYGAAKLVYGEYPPHSSLSYVWSSTEERERILPSPYTAKAQMVLVEKGGAKIGEWVTENVNVLDDYRKAFGADPPAEASVAVMSDADNTGEKAAAYIDYIEMYGNAE